MKYISLVNLILDKPVVTELIQQDFTSENITLEVKKMLTEEKSFQILADYNLLISMLQDENISTKIASDIVNRLHATPH